MQYNTLEITNPYVKRNTNQIPLSLSYFFCTYFNVWSCLVNLVHVDLTLGVQESSLVPLKVRTLSQNR